MKRQLKIKAQNEHLRTYYDLRKPICSCGACTGLCQCFCGGDTTTATNASHRASASVQIGAMSETEARA